MYVPDITVCTSPDLSVNVPGYSIGNNGSVRLLGHLQEEAGFYFQLLLTVEEHYVLRDGTVKNCREC